MLRWLFLSRCGQPRKGPPPPLLRLALDALHLPRDATRVRHGAGQREDDEGGELAADEEHEGEEREAADVVRRAALEEQAGAGRAPVLGDAFHGWLRHDGDVGVGGVVGRYAGGGVEGPDEAGVEVRVLEPCLVEGEVGLPRLEEVREGA